MKKVTSCNVSALQTPKLQILSHWHYKYPIKLTNFQQLIHGEVPLFSERQQAYNTMPHYISLRRCGMELVSNHDSVTQIFALVAIVSMAAIAIAEYY